MNNYGASEPPQYMVDGQLMTEPQMQEYLRQRGFSPSEGGALSNNPAILNNAAAGGGEATNRVNNIFQNMDQEQVLQMYDQQHDQENYPMNNNVDEQDSDHFHDSRVVKTVRNLKRQNSATKPQQFKQQDNALGVHQQHSSGTSQLRGGIHPINPLTVTHNLNPSSLGQKQIPMSQTGGRTMLSGLGTTATTVGKSGASGFGDPSGQTPMGAAVQMTTKSGQPLTAYQKRQLEKAAENPPQLTLQERLARLKNQHNAEMREASGTRKAQHRGSTTMQMMPPAQLDPVEFQKQLAQRAAEERAQLEEFKQREERMKAYQKAKKIGSKPPIPHQASSNNLQNGQASARNLIAAAAATDSTQAQKRQANKPQIKVSTKMVNNEKTTKGNSSTLRRSSNMNASQNSKSTTAHTNDRQGSSHDGDLQIDSEVEQQPVILRPFRLEEETGRRGANPESNKILDDETKAIQQKKDKIVEIFRNNTDIREMIVSQDVNPQGYDLTQIIDMLFEDPHFTNLLGDMLTRKPGTAKLEKFISSQVQKRLKEIKVDQQIQESFQELSERIQGRLARLQNTKFEIPDDFF